MSVCIDTPPVLAVPSSPETLTGKSILLEIASYQVVLVIIIVSNSAGGCKQCTDQHPVVMASREPDPDYGIIKNRILLTTE